jgi:hypothetical protein
MKLTIVLLSAVAMGAGFVLQQHAAEQVPASAFLRLWLFSELATKRRWLAGIAIMVAGEVGSAWAIGHMRLSLAEPLLTSNLLFALLLAVPLSGQALHKAEVTGAVMLSAGVAAVAVSLSAGGRHVSVGSYRYWPAAAVIAAVGYLFVRAGLRRSGQNRALLTGAASGLVFGIADALTRRTVQILDNHSLPAVFTHWPVYAMVAASVVGLWLMESAFSAAPLHASLPAITAAEPLAGMLLGVVVFGDPMPAAPGLFALAAAGMLALVGGVVLVARAPVLSGLRRHRPGIRPAGPRPGKTGLAAASLPRPAIPPDPLPSKSAKTVPGAPTP